ncbi:MAG TPA: hypothetical protein PKC24_03600 [Cyclobacteriaceae bacterium]|nr:hypothetical protein [Cyclobacteriaceae bacterium]
MLINIFENDEVICELDEDIPLLRHFWKKEQSGESFRKNLVILLEEYISLKKTYATLAWMADTRLLGELDEETETWLSDHWQDMLFMKAGVKVHAVILGDSIFADYPMEKFKLEADQKFKEHNVYLGVFPNEEKALSWIKSKMKIIQ